MPAVLVVDDSAVDRHRVGGLLQKHSDWTVAHAAGGAEALAAIDRERPDVVLADLRMPGMNGLELLQAIKGRSPSLPVILMTAFGSEDLAILALQQGAASYLPKRNLSRRLIDTVTDVLGMTQAQRGHRRVLGLLRRTELHFRLDNDPSILSPLVGHLRENLLDFRVCGENEAVRVGLALREALMNAICHGNLELGSAPQGDSDRAYLDLVAERATQAPYRDRHVFLTVKESPEEAVYVVRDEGPGFNVTALPDLRDPAAAEKFGDRGLALIRHFMDEVYHNTQGNEITLIKRRR
jgi:CheY-like chemotaxis protein/anti-sigma regulatory factor (Ser/Thr protein kinase)